MKIKEVMITDVVTCSPNETLSQVAQKMQKENIGGCPVVENDRVIGFITDRDITVRSVAKGFNPNDKTVREFLTPSPITGTSDMSLEEAAEMMANHQIRRLPIVENDKLIGMVALADLAIDLEEEEIVAETLSHISQPKHHKTHH